MLNTIAVVIPVYKQFADLDRYELISFTQACTIFDKYTIFLVTNSSIYIKAYLDKMGTNASVVCFQASYFEGISGYNKLLMQSNFYKHFIDYNYILICQLDVFVFSDIIDNFVDLDYDYIGAPWFESFGSTSNNNKIMGVGNGGFSLRKISSVLKVFSFFHSFEGSYVSTSSINNLIKEPVAFFKTVKHELLKDKNNYPSILPWQYHDQEDIYWSMYIRHFFPWYKVSSVEDAIAFAFEARPELLYELNSNKLPMGVHAWQKYNLEFWKPHIERLGYTL